MQDLTPVTGVYQPARHPRACKCDPCALGLRDYHRLRRNRGADLLDEEIDVIGLILTRAL